MKTLKCSQITKLVLFATPCSLIAAIIFHAYDESASLLASREHWAAKWNNYQYIAIADKSFPDYLKSFVVRSQGFSQLNKTQQILLVLEQMSFFAAYSKGDYQAYRAFRIPSNISFRWKTSRNGSLDYWLNKLKIPGDLQKTSMDSKYRAYLIALDRHGTVFSNYFTSVALNDSRMCVFQYTNPVSGSHDLVPDSSTTIFFTNTPTYNYLSQKLNFSFIEFDDNIEQVAHNDRSVTVADSFLFIKRRDNNIVPLVVRLYWDPGAARWLPDDIAQCPILLDGGHFTPLAF